MIYIYVLKDHWTWKDFRNLAHSLFLQLNVCLHFFRSFHVFRQLKNSVVKSPNSLFAPLLKMTLFITGYVRISDPCICPKIRNLCASMGVKAKIFILSAAYCPRKFWGTSS
ncbi:hypothetical protein XELAEV_18010105mg [Xenopus laevis]|uniref:Uncharacterized protein n=1 Tax=Xenopus laevis TaxID=8355 RepID=A0A974DTW3_XENLA|nr:hypothetical protein XELAEV_18010105mg [Xenopus laevis]